MRVALVTGSAKGIGRGPSSWPWPGRAFARGPSHYRTSEGPWPRPRGQEAEGPWGVRAIKVPGPTSPGRRRVGGALVGGGPATTWGGVGVPGQTTWGDYLYKPIEEVSLEEWRWILDTKPHRHPSSSPKRSSPLMVEQGLWPHRQTWATPGLPTS
jgi:3-oxoacyl-[acyl-carrier protein] reductase